MDKKIVILVFITVFLDLLGFGILIPIQPFFALAFAAKPSVVTLLGASYSLMQFLFVPLWGKISDRYGRRPVMLMSIATSAIGFFIFAYADSLPMLFLSRMISGFGGANIGCAQAIIADMSAQKDRTHGMGLISAAMGMGFIVGPALGGIFGSHGFMLPPLVAGGLSLINLLLAIIFLKETRWRQFQSGTVSKNTPARHALVSNFERNKIYLFAISFLLIMSFALFEQSIGMYLNALLPAADPSQYQQSVQRTSVFLALIALMAATIQLTALKPLSARFGEQRLLLMGTMLSAVALAILPLMAKMAVFYWLLFPGALFAMGFAVCMPCLSSIISQSISLEEQGVVLGKSQSYAALGRVLGPAMCGLLFEYSADLPFFIAALTSFTCFLLIVKMGRIHQSVLTKLI